MKRFFLFSALVLVACQGFGQAYFTAGGIRMGTDWGLTIQQRVADKVTIEGIIQSSFQREEVLFTLLGELHQPIVIRNANIYYGAGAHFGSTTIPDDPSVENPLGITLVGGVELTLGRLNLSYDFKPAINVKGGERGFYAQSGLSARYVLVNNRFYKDMKKAKKKKRRAKERAERRANRSWRFPWEPKD